MDRTYFEDFMTRISFPAEAISDLLACYDFLSENWNSDFSALLNFYAEHDYNYTLIEEQTKILGEKTGVSPYTLWLLTLIYAADKAKETFALRGADEQIYWDTFSDFRYKLMECKEVHDLWGATSYYWYTKFFTGDLFKLGRMQFHRYSFPGKDPYTFGEYTINPGDTVINIHIPSSGEPFDLASRMDSYRKAYAFFKPEDGKALAFICMSWLIYPPYRTILSPQSNLYGFMHDFDIIGQTDTETFVNAWRLYGRDADKPVAEYPEKTSLQRAIKKHLLAGGPSGHGTGIFLFDGEKILNVKDRG